MTYKQRADIIKFMSAKTVLATKCFVCSSQNPRGLRIPFIFEGNQVEANFVADDSYCGFDGIVHGGILFALADEAMMHLIHGSQIKAITSEVTPRLKKIARTNYPLQVVADSLDCGSHLVKCRAVITDADNHIICKADGKFLYYADNHAFKKSGL